MPDSTILGADGRPLRVQSRAYMARPYATATTTGVRQPWDTTSIADGLTPDSLAAALKSADAGDGYNFLTIAAEIERREAHYRSVLGTRRQAVLRLPVTVESASDDAADMALADEVRALVRGPGFRRACSSLLDAVGKGYAVVEMVWDTGRTPWAPRDRTEARTGEVIAGYRWIDPRWFSWHRERPDELRLRDAAAPVEGLPLPPYRYLVHAPGLLSGHPLNSGLARTAVIAYMAKSFALGDWLRFADTYGLPLRLGKYGPDAKEEDLAKLLAAIANLGTDWGAAIPESMRIELIQASGSGSGADVFERLARWADQQISKLVLGQIASSEGQPGALGGNQAQDEVRRDLRDADAADLAETLNRDLVGAYLALNHGGMDPDDAPRILIAEPDADDLAGLVDALARLVPLGLRVEQSIIRDRLGIPDPSPQGELLAAAPVPVSGEPIPVGAPAANRIALHRASALDSTDYADQHTAALERAADAPVDTLLEPIRAALDASLASGEDLADFAERLRRLYPDLPSEEFAAVMGEAVFAADLAGRYDVMQEGA
jgi:phage gp29-like protein